METIPASAQVYITPESEAEFRLRLKAIRGDEVDKKRYTAILYGVARAVPGTPEDSIFDRKREDHEQICARSTWYGKWKNRPEIRAVWELVEEMVRSYRESETLRIEMQAQQILRRAIAEGQIDAVTGLRRTALSTSDRADYRNAASETLLAMGSDEMARRVALLHSSSLPVEITEQPEQVVKLDVSSLAPGLLRAIADEDPGN